MKHDLARKLRRDQTEVERKLWSALRGRRFSGFKFRRQQPSGSYVVDFVCFEKKLVVELDGEQHGFEDKRIRDEKRTRALEEQGHRVLRFWNHQIAKEFGVALDTIHAVLSERA